MVAVCDFHRFFGSGFWILLAIKFRSWIAAIVRNILFRFVFKVCALLLFFSSRSEGSLNVTQSRNGNAPWPGSCDMLPMGRVVFEFLVVWFIFYK